MVNGSSRFLNEINGKIDWSNILNKPTIPTVNNATLTIQKNGTNVQTFTANQSTNVTANITVPTKVSELTNDSGYTSNVGTITGIKMNGASKGTSGVVDLGTVITAHQDISGKADKATTLVGYGITDAKIASGVITLGSNTITPLTSSSSLNAAKLTGTVPASCYTDTDTHRPIQVNGTQILGSNTTALNLKAGTNVSLSNSSGTVTIDATDTKVRQTLISDNTNRPLLMAYSGNTTTTTNVDNVSYRNNSIYANPSTGIITANEYQASVTVNNTPIVASVSGQGIGLTSGGFPICLMSYDNTTGAGDIYTFTTWDGTNTSLKTALSAKANTSDLSGKLDKTGGTMTGSLTLSSGDITVSSGSVVAGSPSAQTAKWCRAYDVNGWVGVQVNSANDAAPVLGVNSQGGVSGSTAHYMLFRDINETSATAYTSGTYIGGYNYNDEWESFLVQGRTGHYWGVIPAIQSNNGVMEVGAILDFHTASTSTNDYNYRLRCTGEGAMTYSGTWTKASSIKIKENIKDMDLDEAKKIFNLRPVSFDYKEGFGQKNQRGLIAEEVAEVLPKLVVAESGEEGTEGWCPASVDYIGVVPYLIKIVQEQQKEIDELKKKVR